MTEKRVSVKISAEGGRQLKAELADIGSTGKKAFEQVEGSARRSGAGLQNASYQIADVFTQITAGTDPMRAIAIQLPQLLGGLGIIGAIAGAAAAGLGILFANMDDGKAATEHLEKSLKGLHEAMRDLNSASDMAAKQPFELAEQFGRNAEAAQKLLDIQRQLAAIKAERSFGEASNSIGNAFGGSEFLGGMSSGELQALSDQVSGLDQRYADLMARVQGFGDITTAADQARWDALQGEIGALDEVYRNTNQYRYEVEQLAASFGITVEAAQQMAVAAAQVREADNTADRLAAAQKLADEIYRSTDGLRDADDATLALYQKLTDALLAGNELAALDIASGINAAANAADRLRANLAAASNFSAPDASGRVVDRGKLNANMSGRGLPADGTNYSLTPAQEKSYQDSLKPKKSCGGGGGGSGKTKSPEDRDREEALRMAEQLIRGTRSEAETYARVQKQLNILLDEGKISQDTYNKALDELGEKYGDAKEAAKGFKDITTDLKDAILDFAVDGTASFDQVAKSIQKMMLQAALFGEGPFGKLFGGGPDGGGGLLALFGKALGLPSFDGGGSTGSGARVGGVDGKGGYYAILHPQEHVTDLTRLRRVTSGGGSGGGGGVVVQNIDQRKSGADVETQTSTMPDGRTMIINTIRDAEGRGEFDKGRRARWGTRPQTVKR